MGIKRILLVLLLTIYGCIQAMRPTDEIRLTRKFWGLPKAAGKQQFIESIQLFANALLMQEVLYNDCREHQKTFLHYIETEEEIQTTFRGNLKFLRINGKMIQIYMPDKPFETIEGLMALINYGYLLRGDQLRSQHLDVISLLQKSDNTECKTLGFWLLKKLECSNTELKDQQQESLVAASLYRTRQLRLSQFLASPDCIKLLNPLVTLEQQYSAMESLISEHMKAVEAITSNPKEVHTASRAYQRTLVHELNNVLTTYEQVRTQCLDYYSQARHLLLKEQPIKGKEKFSLLRLIGNNVQLQLDASLGQQRQITVIAHDILPSKINGLCGKDIEGIKSVAAQIYISLIEDSKALVQEFEASDHNCTPEVTMIKYDLIDPSFDSQPSGFTEFLRPMAQLVTQLQQVPEQDTKQKVFELSFQTPSASAPIARQAECTSIQPCELTQYLQVIASHIQTDHSQEKASAGLHAQDSAVSVTARCKQKPSSEPSAAATSRKPLKTACKKKKQRKVSEPVAQPAKPECASAAPIYSACIAASDKAPRAQGTETLSPAIASTLADILDGKVKKKKKISEKIPAERPAQIPVAPAVPHDKIVAQTENYVTIQDIAHNILLHVYLPLNTGKRTIERRRIAYTDSIEQWFTNPEAALSAKGIIDPHSPSYNPQYKSGLPIIDRMSVERYCFVHNFSRLIDEFILSRGIRQKKLPATYIKKGSEAVTLPGHIEHPDGKQESCSYCYIFSDIMNAMCYHRNIVPQPRIWQTQQLWENGYIPLYDPSQPSATMQ